MATSAVSVTANPNKGRLIQPIVGIQGINTGGQLLMNGPVNSRVHRGSFQCSGFGYGMLTVPTITLQAGDAGTGTFAAVMGTGNNIGQIVGVTILTTNSTRGAGTYPLTITDPVGVGAAGTYTVNGANTITAAVITVTGLTGPIPPDLFFPQSIQHKVNGVIMRDIFAVDILAQVFAQQGIIDGYVPRAGELPFYYTEPWRNVNRHNDTTSWDLVGQSTWTIQANIAATVGAPGVQGWYEFDYIRNARAQTGNGAAKDINGNVVPAGKIGMFPFVQPIRHHSYQNTVPAGVSNINWLPFDFPIVRMWFNETGAGSITQLEIWEDSNQILLVTFEQGLEAYGAYGFSFGRGTVTVTQTGAVVNGAWSSTQACTHNFKTYDGLYIADPDQRLFKALIVDKQFICKVTSTANTNLNVFMETLPGAYK